MIIKSLNPESYQRIAVISDIHSNITALKAVIQQLKKEPLDAVICLGDLLTYGTEPLAVIEALKSMQKEWPVYFIKGNHDQFYFDLQAGKKTQYKNIPGFITESIQWNLEQLEQPLLESFEWNEALSLNEALFAHANPFDYGDWTYLRDEESLEKAALALKEKGFSLGCFGHTHRMDEYHHSGATVLNSGSVGQPRGSDSSFALFSFAQGQWNYEWRKIDYDVSEHLIRIENSSLSKATKDKLLAYFL